MTNSEVREWYLARAAEIPKLNQQWISQKVSLEDRARGAYRIRHDARLEARGMMENKAEVEDLRERDRRLYGNPDGPTFEQLMEENRKRGMTLGQSYESIIEGAQTTNKSVNQHLDARRAPH